MMPAGYALTVRVGSEGPETVYAGGGGAGNIEVVAVLPPIIRMPCS